MMTIIYYYIFWIVLSYFYGMRAGAMCVFLVVILNSISGLLAIACQLSNVVGTGPEEMLNLDGMTCRMVYIGGLTLCLIRMSQFTLILCCLL